MIISLNWLKKYTDITMPVDELVTLIGSRLVEIEDVEYLGEKYRDVLIARVVECAAVEGSDHLNLTKIDDGGVAADVARDEHGYVQVVCGAPNVAAGMLVAWLPPGSTVPETFGTKEPFILGARELRGFISNGMIASARELALYDEHEGIIVVDKDAAPGTPFAEVYGLDDYLLNIENKSLTHRPDCFGVIGFAREVAAISGHAFKTPDWLTDVQPVITTTGAVEAPKVHIDDDQISDRYQAIVLHSHGQAGQTPLEIKTYLSRSGVRPISPIVDVTNYLMLLSGQPLHAFDYDKVLALNNGQGDIHVRLARSGETLKLLDGKTIDLHTTDIVIASGDTPIGLAGAMGGFDTEIDDTTNSVILESATFNLYRLRSTQMRHGIFSEAITRFTKGQPAELTAPVLAEAVQLMSKNAGLDASSTVAEAYPTPSDNIHITVEASAVNAALGTKFATSDIVELLGNAEFDASGAEEAIAIAVPYWRKDIHIAEDIYEEVGRLNGFDMIEPKLPVRDFSAVMPSDFEQLRTHMRTNLARAGANEVLTYTFVHGDTMKAALQNSDEAYRIVNSISPDLQYYRQSLTPSLLTHIHANIKAGYPHFALYEFNKFHTKRHDVTDEAVPKELDGLAFVITDSKAKGVAYYEAKRHLDFLLSTMGIEAVYEPLEEQGDYPVTMPFEPKRSARVWSKDRSRIGVIGEYKASVRRAFKLPEHTAGFEIAPQALLALTQQQGPSYSPSSRFPSVGRDICFQIPASVPYAQLMAAIPSSEADIVITVEPLDMYQPPETDLKNITVRLSFVSMNKTLVGAEVNELVGRVIETVTSHIDARII
ncbi:MAG: pheT [Candidatus Saccharibacteria bacterium]|nr:pheT [Candidatus Saccharibacteria bacterium]